MPIYTRGGDAGQTGLLGNQRVAKDAPRIDAYGNVDELNAFLGLLGTEAVPGPWDERLLGIQSTLFDLGADLAAPGARSSVDRVVAATAEFERWIDEADGALPPLRSFILPGGHRQAALLHVARTVCRRAERSFWALAKVEAVPAEIGIYLNRLSDLLFVWARAANAAGRVDDVPWVGRP